MKISKQGVYGFVAVNLITGTAAGIMQMVIPLYAVSLRAGSLEVGLIRGITSLGSLFLVLPVGFLIDAYGSRKLYLTGSFLSALFVFLMPTVRSPLGLMLLMSLYGVVNSLRFTALNAAFFRYLNQNGGGRAGWHRGSISAGLTFFGPFLGGIFISVIGFSSQFAVIGGLILLSNILMMLYPDPFEHGGSKPSEGFDLKDGITQLKLLLHNNRIWRVLAMESLTTACFSSFTTFVTILSVKQLGYQPYQASWLIILEGVAFVGILLFGNGLVRRFQENPLYNVSFSLLIGAMILLATSGNLGLLGLGSGMMGLSLGMVNLLTYSQLSTYCGASGKVSSLLSACTGLGATAGPVFSGLIGVYFGIRAVFLSYVPVFLLAAVFGYLAVRMMREPGAVVQDASIIPNEVEL